MKPEIFTKSVKGSIKFGPAAEPKETFQYEHSRESMQEQHMESVLDRLKRGKNIGKKENTGSIKCNVPLYSLVDKDARQRFTSESTSQFQTTPKSHSGIECNILSSSGFTLGGPYKYAAKQPSDGVISNLHRICMLQLNALLEEGS